MIWGTKQVQGIDNLYTQVYDILKTVKPSMTYEADLREKLDEIGWRHGPPPRQLYSDSPGECVQRAIAGLAMCRLLQKNFKGEK